MQWHLWRDWRGKTSWGKHCSLPFKNTKMSTLPKHLHWTWTILSEWIMCGMNYKWGHDKIFYSESAMAEYEWATWSNWQSRKEKSLTSNSWQIWWIYYGRVIPVGFWAKLWKKEKCRGWQMVFFTNLPTEIFKVLAWTQEERRTDSNSQKR